MISIDIKGLVKEVFVKLEEDKRERAERAYEKKLEKESQNLFNVLKHEAEAPSATDQERHAQKSRLASLSNLSDTEREEVKERAREKFRTFFTEINTEINNEN